LYLEEVLPHFLKTNRRTLSQADREIDLSGSVSEHHFSQRDKKPREHPTVMKKRYQIGPGAAESLEIGWPEPSGNVSIFL